MSDRPELTDNEIVRRPPQFKVKKSNLKYNFTRTRRCDFRDIPQSESLSFALSKLEKQL